ncbi:hypothetical protein F4824DRAFT_510509 [Ustulina deusta]|nr:hypothetical protein F4823DRAFT_632357 [Ustulina deusta]KAI3335966.1 hypothetical protein F4824DRAFT_510509 [Ustulina deusta]
MLLPKTYSLLAATAANLLPSQNVYQFPDNGTWLENIAVRSNGDLLLTMLSPTPSLYTLKQPYSSSPEISLIHTFPNATGLLGITETEDDTFAIISTQLIDNSAPVLGSSAIWEVAFSGDTASTRKIAGLPDLGLPNGATLAIPGAQAVLIADCLGGTVTRCDTQTGETTTVLSVDETKGVADVDDSLGINGMHYQDGYLYWSNSALVSIFRISVDEDGNPVAGAEPELIGEIDALFVDDFALDSSNTAWVATNPSNTIVALKSDGSSQVVVGGSDSSTVAGATSGAFGRTTKDSKKLYVTTRGVSEPAKVVAVDTSSFA